MFVSVWPGVKNRNLTPGGRNIVVLFYSFFYLDSIHYVYLKWFISIQTSSRYICSIFLLRKFVTIKDWIDSIERRFKIKEKKMNKEKSKENTNEWNIMKYRK